MILGWRERAEFIAMGELPTDNHVKVLRAVHESLNGIEAISQKQLGLECVTNGWLEHTQHRRDDGGVVDVWILTQRGRLIIESRADEVRPSSLIEAG